MEQNARNIVCQLHRGKQIMWTRHYKHIDTAVPRAVQLSLQSGQPKDVLQFSHQVTGMALGELKISTRGAMAFTAIPGDSDGHSLLDLCSTSSQ